MPKTLFDIDLLVCKRIYPFVNNGDLRAHLQCLQHPLDLLHIQPAAVNIESLETVLERALCDCLQQRLYLVLVVFPVVRVGVSALTKTEELDLVVGSLEVGRSGEVQLRAAEGESLDVGSALEQSLEVGGWEV